MKNKKISPIEPINLKYLSTRFSEEELQNFFPKMYKEQKESLIKPAQTPERSEEVYLVTKAQLKDLYLAGTNNVDCDGDIIIEVDNDFNDWLTELKFNKLSKQGFAFDMDKLEKMKLPPKMCIEIFLKVLAAATPLHNIPE